MKDPALVVSQPREYLWSGLSTQEKPIQVTRIPNELIRKKRVPMVQVVWDHDGIHETTKERASMMRIEYLELFET